MAHRGPPLLQTPSSPRFPERSLKSHSLVSAPLPRYSGPCPHTFLIHLASRRHPKPEAAEKLCPRPRRAALAHLHPPAPTCGLRRREDLAKQARQSPWLSGASVSGSEDVARRGREQRRRKAVLECAVPGRGGRGDRRPRGRGGGREPGVHKAGGAGPGVTGARQGEPGRRGRGLLGAGHAARLGGSQRGRGGPGAKGPSLLCRVARRLRWKCSAALRVK